MMLPLSIATASVAGLVYATVSPSCRFWGPVVCRGSSAHRRVALTFDDGPTPGGTDRILDILRQNNVQATFFVIGVNIEKSPDLLRRIYAEGHLIGNHTYNHSHYGMMRGNRYWLDQLRRTDELIEKIVGRGPVLFRPPMGVKTFHVTWAVRQRNLTTVAWSKRANDGFATTPEKIVSRLTRDIGPGDILLLHDGIEPNHHRDPRPTVEALQPLLEVLKRKTLEPVRLDRLL
jgi:peptidoglycan/xylan/chitin deacetylase (PgdA/CDA1 family)